MARPHKRGALLCAQGTVTIVGLCIAYWLDYGLSFIDNPVQWRFPISFQAFFAVCLVLQMLPLPESPRWLLEHGRTTRATSILARLQYNYANENSEEVVTLRKHIETALELEHAEGPFRYAELFQGGQIQNFRRMLLCALINIMQQFTGSNMINYYAPTVYTNAMGLSRNLSLILGGCTSLTYLMGSFIPLFVCDRFGRRSLLMVSAAGLCVCFVLVAALLSTGKTSDAYAATAFVFLFQVSGQCIWKPTSTFDICTDLPRYRLPPNPMVLSLRDYNNTHPLKRPSRKFSISTINHKLVFPTDIFPYQKFGAFINWLSVFAVVQITPIAIDNIGWRTFIIFACFCFTWIPLVYCFFPETSGLRLEDVEFLFEKGGVTGGVFRAKGGRTVMPGWRDEVRDEEGGKGLGIEMKEDGTEPGAV